MYFPAPGPGPRPLFVFWQPKSQFVYRGPVPKFVFTSSGPQSVFVSPQPSICIYWPWLIRIRIIKSQRLHIMLLYLFLLSNSFVTVIGCCSLLLLYLRLLFISIGYLCFPTSGPRSGPRSSISIYWSRPSVFVCLFFAAKVCYSYRVYLHKLSVYI